MGRRVYVLPEYRSEGLHFSLKEWEPDRPDSITFVILSEDDVQSRFILKVGAMSNEKVLLYYETKQNGTLLAFRIYSYLNSSVTTFIHILQV